MPPLPEVMPSFFDRRASDRDLRVLLVSDVHCSLTNVHRLAELLTERAQYVDMIWLAGDVIKLTPEDRRVPAKYSASEGDMSAVLSALENIHCRVVYVPGAHDPSSTILSRDDQPLPRLTPQSCNLHGRCLRVAPELVLVGYGGGARNWEARDTRHFRTLLAPHPAPSSPHTAGSVGDAGLDAMARSGEKVRRLGQDKILPGDSVVLITHSASHVASTPTDQGVCEHKSWTGVEGADGLLRDLVLEAEEAEAKVGARLILHCHGSDAEVETRPGDVQEGGCVPEGEMLLEPRRGSFRTFEHPVLSSQAADMKASGPCGECGECGNRRGISRELDAQKGGREGRLGSMTVVEPGALSRGHFCLLTLSRQDPEGCWHLSHREFLHLVM